MAKDKKEIMAKNQTEQQRQEAIYRVTFTERPLANDPRSDFFFHSLAAIYDTFTAEQIGCQVTHLYNYGIMQGRPYVNRQVKISREPIYRKKRTAGATEAVHGADDNLHEKNI